MIIIIFGRLKKRKDRTNLLQG